MVSGAKAMCTVSEWAVS